MPISNNANNNDNPASFSERMRPTVAEDYRRWQVGRLMAGSNLRIAASSWAGEFRLTRTFYVPSLYFVGHPLIFLSQFSQRVDGARVGDSLADLPIPLRRCPQLFRLCHPDPRHLTRARNDAWHCATPGERMSGAEVRNSKRDRSVN